MLDRIRGGYSLLLGQGGGTSEIRGFDRSFCGVPDHNEGLSLPLLQVVVNVTNYTNCSTEGSLSI